MGVAAAEARTVVLFYVHSEDEQMFCGWWLNGVDIAYHVAQCAE